MIPSNRISAVMMSIGPGPETFTKGEADRFESEDWDEKRGAPQTDQL
jgi:hypothetical protein